MAFTPLMLLYGICPLWKAFASPFTLPGFSNSLIQVTAPLLVLLVWMIRKPQGLPRNMVWATGIAGACSTLLIATVQSPSLNLGAISTAVGTFGSIILFVTYSLFFILWSQLYAQLNVALAGSVIGGSYVLASIAFFFLSHLDSLVCLGIAACLPLLSAGALVACLDRIGDAAPVFSPCCTTLKGLFHSGLFPWRIVLAITAYSLAAGVSRSFTSTSEDLCAVGIAGIVCIVFILFPWAHSVSVYRGCRLTFTIMALCLLSGIILGQSSTAHLLIGIAQTLTSIILVVLLCDSSHRFGLPVLPVMAIARSITAAAFLMGGVLSQIALNAFSDTQIIMSAAYGIAMAIIIVASIWWLTIVPDDRGEAPQADQTADAVDMHPDQIPPALESVIKSRADKLGKEYGLSKRETEVLTLLAWGKSAKRIEELLVLSPNTVKTHVKHVYAKMGIHSRTELDALIFRE